MGTMECSESVMRLRCQYWTMILGKKSITLILRYFELGFIWVNGRFKSHINDHKCGYNGIQPWNFNDSNSNFMEAYGAICMGILLMISQ